MNNLLIKSVKGFTLIELLITLTIIGVLASIALPLTEVAVQRSKEQELKSNLRQIRESIDAYKKAADEGFIKKSINESGYPPTLESLAYGVENIRDPQRKKIYFLRKIPRDPMFDDSTVKSHDTWGKRSYDSPHDSPREGKDVFDVYSLSTGSGLNGIPYREW